MKCTHSGGKMVFGHPKLNPKSNITMKYLWKNLFVSKDLAALERHKYKFDFLFFVYKKN